MGYALGTASGPITLGQSPNQGHSPRKILRSATARQSLASHQTAKPQRVVKESWTS